MKRLSWYILLFSMFSVGSAKAVLTESEKKVLEKAYEAFGVLARDASDNLVEESDAIRLEAAKRDMEEFYRAMSAKKVEEATKTFSDKVKYYGYGPGLSFGTRIFLIGAYAAIVGGITFRESIIRKLVN